MGINTKIILIPCTVADILTKEGFSAMVALMCILGGLPKNDRVASFRFRQVCLLHGLLKIVTGLQISRGAFG